MPNWCAQMLSLTGTKAECDRCVNDCITAYQAGLAGDEGASDMDGVWTPRVDKVPKWVFTDEGDKQKEHPPKKIDRNAKHPYCRKVSAVSMELARDEQGKVIMESCGLKCLWNLETMYAGERSKPAKLIFTSKWTPCYSDEELAKIAKTYPNIKFTFDYAEQGQDICGRMIAHNPTGREDVKEATAQELTSVMKTADFKELFRMSG